MQRYSTLFGENKVIVFSRSRCTHN